jgi:iron-sulfur cluster assembly protein
MIQMTNNAANLIVKMLSRNGIEGGGLRVGVKAGGCSGLSYIFAWEKEPRPDDQIFEGADGARIFIDPKSHRFLDGTTLDYDTSLISKGFVLNNPHAKSTCGCGTSFDV